MKTKFKINMNVKNNPCEFNLELEIEYLLRLYYEKINE